ncbi:MAG: hypothetical protein JW702_01370 [Clostridiales bacterium]|nr:hypothetical protein [Clostridiales bacterium]
MSTIVHFELAYEDKDRVKNFYKNVFDWQYESDDFFDYDLIYTKENSKNYGINGGLQGENNFNQKIILTIECDQIEKKINDVISNGGIIIVPTQELPGIGKLAYFRDPEGTIMGLMESLK